MSVSRETVACYRLYAVNCVELADRVHDPDRRIFLLNMARDWRKLADQIEHEELVLPDVQPPGDRSYSK